MTPATRYLTLGAILSVGVAAGVAVSGRISPSHASREIDDPSKVLQAAFNRATSVAMKSVVHIITTGAADVDGAQEGFASGVIVSENGRIITNHHVVRNVKAILVRFADNAEFSATIVGKDPESDLAVLQIDAAGRKLHPMAFADSEKVRVGDIVFAIGSPFGYNHTVTSGIVSAKHRRMELGQPYEDFVQTDASINPGNSGGALVNINGELVGLNAAIGPPGEKSEGVGLAISANLVKWVQERLIRDGTVHRGYLGIAPLDISLSSIQDAGLAEERRFRGIRDAKELLEELGLAEPRGVLVKFVEKNSPASGALELNDVVTSLDGKAVRDRHDLFFRIAECDPGRKVKIQFVRDRKPMESEVTLAERPPFDRWGKPRK